MAKVVKREFEDIESLLRRWKRKVNDEKILSDLKKQEFYVSPAQKRREKSKAARLKKAKQDKAQQRYQARSEEFKNAVKFNPDKRFEKRYAQYNVPQQKQ